MTREERRKHQERGQALSEYARKIAFDLAAAFDSNGRADMMKLAGLGPKARKFRDAYEDWWKQK
jgi:hypothetical protein